MRNNDKVSILIVDEDTSVSGFLGNLLEEEGYEVFKTSNGERAIETLKNNHCSLVLLDVTLPGMSGTEVLIKVKENYKQTEVIMVTGHATVDSTLESLRHGAYDYMVKPFDIDHVLLTVGKALEKQHLLAENELLNGVLKAKVRRLAILNELGKAMHSILDLQELLDFFVELVSDVMGAKRVSLMLQEKGTGDLVINASVGLDKSLVGQVIDDADERVAGRVLKEGKPVLVEDAKTSNQVIRKGNQGYVADSFISAPLILSVPIQLKKEIVGVINVSNKDGQETFSDEDVDFLSMLASHAAHAFENARMFEELKTANEKLEQSNLETIKALADSLEAKDAHTKGHSDRTELYAMEIAVRLGLDDVDKNKLKYAAILHDIGKIGISETILNKPARLTDEEYEIMKNHPVVGADILKNISFLEPVAPLVKAHHERYDGKGYPDGLAGDRIPIQSRIVSILDSFDAMTNDRPYRKAPGEEWAISELKKFSGTQFDPDVVEAFLSIIEKDSDQKVERRLKLML